MLRNRQVKSRLKTLERQFQACLETNDEEAARKASAEFISALDRAAKSSIIHHNKAARKKSACAKRLSEASSSSRAPEKPDSTEQEEILEEPVNESAQGGEVAAES